MRRGRLIRAALGAAAAAGCLLALLLPDSSANAAPPKKVCITDNPLAPGDCLQHGNLHHERITYRNPAPPHQYITDHVDSIHPYTYVDAYGGPNGTTHKRISGESPCAYYKVFTGTQIVEQPAPPVFNGTHDVHDNYWIHQYSGKTLLPPKQRWFNHMQLPHGVGWIELPIHGYIDYETYQNVQARYTDTIHLSYLTHLPDTVDYTNAWEHRKDSTGWWWTYECSFGRYTQLQDVQPTQWQVDTVKRLHAENPNTWEFWEPGDETPPSVPIPPWPVETLMKLVIPQLGLDSAPPTKANLVGLKTSLWETDDFARYPITIHSGGDTAVATPGPLRVVSGLPSDADHDLKCTNGVTRNPDGQLDTDCWITFHTSTEQGHPVKITFAQTWTITKNGQPVAGNAGHVVREQTLNFTVRQSQTTGGN